VSYVEALAWLKSTASTKCACRAMGAGGCQWWDKQLRETFQESKMIGKIMIREIETRVIKATAENLAKFAAKELRGYCDCNSVSGTGTKQEIIDRLMATGKATMLAQLGN